MDNAKYAFASRFVDSKRVLCVSSGYGYGCSILLNSSPKEIIAVDNSSEIISFARRKYSSRKLKFRLADAMKLPYGNSSFDVIVSIETIEHLPMPEKFLVEAKRVLRRDGLLILSTPNKTVDAILFDKPCHINLMRTSEIKQMLAKIFGNHRHYLQIPFQKKPVLLAVFHAFSAMLLNDGKIIPAKQNLVGLTNLFVVKKI